MPLVSGKIDIIYPGHIDFKGSADTFIPYGHLTFLQGKRSVMLLIGVSPDPFYNTLLDISVKGSGIDTKLVSSERAVESASAEARRIQTQIDDSSLTAPRPGRIEYRLAEPGEVLASGGKVVTLLDLSDVYMTIFLPTAQAGRVFIGSEARIILDAAPQLVIPAKVSFVSAQAQFTPREVETQSEREKLMFRVKVKIDPAVLRAHMEKVKTGLPGEAYVLLGSNATWPERFAVKLPPVSKK